MRNFRKSAAACAAVVMAAACSLVFAQDDLDNLLNDLEGGSKKAAKAEPAAVTAQPATEEKAEAKAEEAKPETEAKEEAKTEEPAAKADSAAVAAQPAAEEKAEAKAEENKSEPETKEEANTEEPAAKAEPAAVAAQSADGAKSAPAAKPANPDAELMANIVATEKLRRTAFDEQAKREITEARASMKKGEYEDCASHYSKALKLLNDSAATIDYRRECRQGVAEALYRAALQEEAIGQREKAIETLRKAVEMRHPKARRQLEDWTKDVKEEEAKDFADIAHRRNETAYQEKREKNRRHLRRARQLLAVRDIEGALEECEMVLVKGNDPYNQEAIRLRGAIQKKRALILGSEFEVAREGMIADVDKAWRPVYAPNARELEAVASTTIKKTLGEDPERAVEQTIVERMKKMRLPTISFKPPATIIDAVEYFRGASRDFDRPDIPLEQRGFNFVLKTPEALHAQATPTEGAAESDDFGAQGNEEQPAAQTGVPVIPMITASDISFYEALKLVCDSVNYKFKVQGPIVMVMDKAMTVDEMVTRSYPVKAAFFEKMDTVSSEMKELKSSGFGGGSSSKKEGGEENKENDWKGVFTELGVEWPEGSSIFYMKATGKLRVKNTYDNLAELEKALVELNAADSLIEIEARFVEVSQEDLNSLGFEWILNSDYGIGMDNWLGDALNMKGGSWEGGKETVNTLTGYKTVTTTSGGTTTQTVSPIYTSSTKYNSTQGASWVKDVAESANMGLNAFGGSSDYQNGMRYLSTEGNHISGENKSTNDQFMRVNAFLGNADLSMILHMLSQRSDTDLLNAPKVLTKPGEQAVIKVVTEYIYPTDYDVQLQSSSSGSSGSSGSSQSAVLAVVEPQSFTMREVGVILDVTPMLAEDGHLIDLKLNTQVVDEPTWKNYGMKIPFTGNSSLQSFEGIGGILDGLTGVLNTLGSGLDESTKTLFAAKAVESATSALDSLSTQSSGNIQYYEAPMEQPWFHVRSIDSSVSIYPGATIVMGGLIREERKAMDDKIPFLGDLPFAGRFFRSHAEQTVKRNLLIFLTARKVDTRGREVTGEAETTTDAHVKAAPEQKAE